MGLKKYNGKNDKMSNILEAAFRQYTLLRDCTFKFILIASSVSIGEAITHENDCLPYVCFALLFLPLALVDPGPLQHLRWCSLWKMSTAWNYCYCYKEFHLICARNGWSAYKENRVFLQCLGFTGRILLWLVMLWLIIVWVLKTIDYSS